MSRIRVLLPLAALTLAALGGCGQQEGVDPEPGPRPQVADSATFTVAGAPAEEAAATLEARAEAAGLDLQVTPRGTTVVISSQQKPLGNTVWLTTPGRLTVRAVLATGARAELTGDLVVHSPEQNTWLALGPPVITAEDVRAVTANAPTRNDNQWGVHLGFTERGRAAWQVLTADAACARDAGAPLGPSMAAILQDDRVLATPTPASSVACGVGIPSGDTAITGFTGADQARQIASAMAHPLPSGMTLTLE